MLNFEMNEKHFPVYLLAGTKFHLALRADGMLADNKSFVTLYAINIYGEIKNWSSTIKIKYFLYL